MAATSLLQQLQNISAQLNAQGLNGGQMNLPQLSMNLPEGLFAAANSGGNGNSFFQNFAQPNPANTFQPFSMFSPSNALSNQQVMSALPFLNALQQEQRATMSFSATKPVQQQTISQVQSQPQLAAQVPKAAPKRGDIRKRRWDELLGSVCAAVKAEGLNDGTAPSDSKSSDGPKSKTAKTDKSKSPSPPTSPSTSSSDEEYEDGAKSSPASATTTTTSSTSTGVATTSTSTSSRKFARKDLSYLSRTPPELQIYLVAWLARHTVIETNGSQDALYHCWKCVPPKGAVPGNNRTGTTTYIRIAVPRQLRAPGLPGKYQAHHVYAMNLGMLPSDPLHMVASRRCGHLWCVAPHHLVWETVSENFLRERSGRCPGGDACTHGPMRCFAFPANNPTLQAHSPTASSYATTSNSSPTHASTPSSSIPSPQGVTSPTSTDPTNNNGH